jgi:16S rRNA processing protein RimM
MDLIAIGKISKPIGTQGEVKILPLTDKQQRFVNLPSVYLGKNAANTELMNILKVRFDSRQIVLCFQGIGTVEEAKKLTGCYLFVQKENAVKLQDGNYFIDDVIGCEVLTEERKNVGIITDLLTLPMNDVWVVKKDAKELLIPAVKSIIRQVDIEHKRVTIHALDGLLD